MVISTIQITKNIILVGTVIPIRIFSQKKILWSKEFIGTGKEIKDQIQILKTLKVHLSQLLLKKMITATSFVPRQSLKKDIQISKDAMMTTKFLD